MVGHYGSEYTPPGIYNGDYTTSQDTTEYTPIEPYQAEYTQESSEYSETRFEPKYISGSQFSPSEQYSNNPHVIQYSPYYGY